ncbi:MAG TPA: SGNH/GDSL hydrolase family protein [Jatrophihabitans sp.]|nr:SGNH/GDSL hydrolase family protein [Jatrophihabitans sp.]
MPTKMWPTWRKPWPHSGATHRSGRRSAAKTMIGGAVGVAACLVLTAAVPAVASARQSAGSGSAPVQSGSGYLALGDSVSFGYREAANPPPPDYPDAASFVGYPEDVAADLSLRVANAACPGETSASLINAAAPSNGCERSATGGPGYRDAFPLHVTYNGSQLHYAVRYLQRHADVRLVSLMIGANDAFRCQTTTADHCASELPAVLAQISANVATILGRIRHDAGYDGQIVIVNYYSLNYADPSSTAGAQALNQAMDTAAAPFDVQIADGFAAFQQAAAQAGGNSCTAGLLTMLSTGGCGVHPSVAGQQLLAGAVERVVAKA